MPTAMYLKLTCSVRPVRGSVRFMVTSAEPWLSCMMLVTFLASTSPGAPLIVPHMSTGAAEKATMSNPPEVSSTICGMPTDSMPEIIESVVTVKMTSPKMNMLRAVRILALRG